MVTRRQYLAAFAVVASIHDTSSRSERADGRRRPDRQDATVERTTAPVSNASVLDIRDFGAAVDGTTDDTSAVRDAIAAATAGDTVWFPAGTTRLTTRSRDAILLDGDEIPDNLTLAGTGPDSRLRLADGEVENPAVIHIVINSGFTGLAIRQLHIDGNREGQVVSGGHAIRASSAETSTTRADGLIQNVVAEDTTQTGILLRHPGLDIRHCTVKSCTKHGIALSFDTGPTDKPPASLPPFVVKNTHCTLNGKKDPAPTYGIDCSGGVILVQDCVCQNNSQGVKTTAKSTDITYRRVRLEENDVNGYIRAGTRDTNRTTVTFDDVVARKNGNHGFRLSRKTDYNVPTALLARANGASNVRVATDAELDAATVWSSHAVDAVGLKSDTTVGGDIETYHPYQNDEGPLDSNGTVEIKTQEAEDKPDIDGVPVAADVGVDGKEIFTVTDVGIETAEPTVNRETEIQATVESRSDERENVFLVLSVDDDVTDTTAVTVAPGETATAPFAPVFETAGDFTLSVAGGEEVDLSVAPLTRDSYTDGFGDVNSESLGTAIDDWREGYIPFGLLRDLMETWETPTPPRERSRSRP